jgi:hypothetical protein
MHPQIAANRLRESISAPPGAVTVWPWHHDDGHVTMIVVIDPQYWVDTGQIPKYFEGFDVTIEKRSPPIVQAC